MKRRVTIPETVGGTLAAMVVGVAGLSMVPLSSHAQEWRTLESSRQLRDSLPLDVRVTYGAGVLRLASTTDRVLYAMKLKYDANHSEPRHDFDKADRSLRVGLGRNSGGGFSIRTGREGMLDLELAQGVPMDLTLDVGAVKGTLELGGLAVRRMDLRTGASDVTARFGSPNPVSMSQLSISSGAASVTIERLGNANVRVVDVDVGVGSVSLDFGGEWTTNDVEVQASVAVGGLTIRVPRDVAIDIDLHRTLASFKRSGLEQRGKRYVTNDTDGAVRRLRVNGSAALGSVEIIRY